MDAEAYSEASKSVLPIVWNVVTSSQDRQWAKARISALESLSQYEVYPTMQMLLFCMSGLLFY